MIEIELSKSAANFVPGETIAGTVTWSQEEGVSLEIRLIWYTVGKGDRDFALVAAHKVASFAPVGTEAFEFAAPARPQSFSGKLISLQWAIEAIIFPDQNAQRVDLTISKTGQEIVLASASGSDRSSVADRS